MTEENKPMVASELLADIDAAFGNLNECRRRATELSTTGIDSEDVRGWHDPARIKARMDADLELYQAQDEVRRLELRAVTVQALATLQAAQPLPFRPYPGTEYPS